MYIFLPLLPIICILCYAVPQIVYLILGDNNLKEKYGKNQKAVWAVVTGASSGIGKSLTFKLAAKGINVVLVAKDDALMTELQPILREKFPLQQFRFIATDLSDSSGKYLHDIIHNTDDLLVSLLFNNAGYLLMDNFATSRLDDKLAHLECNVTSIVRITDHFYRKMVDSNSAGAISFTASSLAYCPTPYAPMYSAAKAFLSAFATSFAIEAKENGVDVFVIHPGAVVTAFYEKSPNFIVFAILKFIGQTADSVAELILRNLGRTHSYDSGIFAVFAKIADKLLGPNIMIQVMRLVIRILPDMRKKFDKKSN